MGIVGECAEDDSVPDGVGTFLAIPEVEIKRINNRSSPKGHHKSSPTMRTIYTPRFQDTTCQHKVSAELVR